MASGDRWIVGLYDAAGPYDEYATNDLHTALKVRAKWDEYWGRQKTTLLFDGEQDGRALDDDEIEELIHGRDDDDAA